MNFTKTVAPDNSDPRDRVLAWLASYILFGLLFVQALASFLSISWSRTMTVTFYFVALGWGALLILKFRKRLRIGTLQNVFFSGFVSIVLASIVFSPDQSPAIDKFASYIPFMVMLPYICGSLMRSSDIKVFQQCILGAAWILLPLLILDRLGFTTSAHGARWPFFGMNHSPLLISAVIAATMIVSCIGIVDSSRPEKRTRRSSQIWRSVGLALMVVALVWVSARGWLIAGLVGCAAVCITAGHVSPLRRAMIFFLIVLMAAVSWKMLPYIDHEFGGTYKQVAMSSLDTEVWLWVSKPAPELSKPILGDASCEPFRKGVNSIEMRWVLYQEAVAIFLENPVTGVGAGKFGYYSCTGPAGFPHSTILQSFAEFGLMGGGLYIALLLLACIKLLHLRSSRSRTETHSESIFMIGLFVAFVLADQLYGNYLMAIGSWMLLGMIGGMHAAEPRGPVNAT